jgi:lambda family phage portal protein
MRRVVRAKFDSAQTTPENRKHWAMADGLSADMAANPSVRRIIRNRSRSEVANNSYARGIVLTLAHDVIGTGPRLQMLLGNGENSAKRGLNGFIEREFAYWCKVVDLPGKLRTMRMSRAQDGEAFAMLFSNNNLQHPMKLDLRLIEADQVATPSFSADKPENGTDGIEFDAYGNPAVYHVLSEHPGGGSASGKTDYDRVPAASMIHWFRTDRPGQYRGLPDIMPALPLFAQLRRYTLAVVTAAETAANLALVMKTNIPPGGQAADIEAFSEMDFTPNMGVFAPEGWEPYQIKAEQPATAYAEFKRELLNEIARCLNMPFNIAACNSSGYNYSSGRLDHQVYYKSIRVEQDHLEDIALDRILRAWLAEAVKVYAELVDAEDEIVDVIVSDSVPHQWFWDGPQHVDPAKEANAQAIRLENNTTTLADEYAREGKDWETQVRQRAREIKLCKKLGLPLKLAAPSAPAANPQEEDDDEQDQAA